MQPASSGSAIVTGSGSSAEAKLTRFLMFEPVDDSGLVWRIVGVMDADGRDSAEARFYRDVDEPVRCAPVSENAWKPRTTKPRVVQPRSRTPFAIDLSALPSSSPRSGDTPAPDVAPDAVGEDGAGADLEIEGLTLEGEDADALADAELAEAATP